MEGGRRGWLLAHSNDEAAIAPPSLHHQFKPEPALELIQRWIANEDWQAYDADCTAPPSAPRVAGKVGAAAELASVKAQMALLEKRATELEHEL